jgi:hypothetical protein
VLLSRILAGRTAASGDAGLLTGWLKAAGVENLFENLRVIARRPYHAAYNNQKRRLEPDPEQRVDRVPDQARSRAS